MGIAVLTLITLGVAWGGSILPPHVLSFTLNEAPSVLVKKFSGQKPNIVKQPTFRMLQFHEATAHENHSCDGAFAWEFYYDVSGEMQSVTWNGEAPLAVSKLFPTKDRLVFSTETMPGTTAMVFVRRLPGDRVLISNVSSPLQTEVQQAVMMRESAVGRFLPWLARELKADHAASK
ncbi:MAG: hypothetical protein H7039_08365 [Bryobacteraceae bacterium]|nr:hypothetical protein [Bryobacteraceae bacterium]